MEKSLTRLTNDQLINVKVGDVVYLRGHVNEPDTPGFNGSPSVYFEDWKKIGKKFIPQKQAVINPFRTKGPTIFVRDTLNDNCLLAVPKDKAFKRGDEVFVSFVITKIHEKEDWDEWDYFRALAKRGTSLNDICSQTFLIVEGEYECHMVL